MRLLPRHSEHGWTPYVWLIYAIPYAAWPFVVPTRVLGSPAAGWLAWLAGLGLFLALYFRSYWVDGSRRLPLIGAIAGLGILMVPTNPGAVVFFIYASGFVGGAAAGRRARYGIVGLTVTGILAALLSPFEPLLAMAGVALMAPIIGFVNLHYAETRQRDASLALAHEEIARLAAVAERERIAGDLHDLLGHTLSVIVLKSELAAKLLPRDSARAAAEIADVERVSREALAEVRRAVHGFRSATLAEELTRARAVLASAGVDVEVDARARTGSAAGEAGLPARLDHAAAMILREAVTNIVRHARASSCRIAVADDDQRLVLRIEDDGVGGAVVAGAGVESMRARARDVGGTLELRGEQGVAVILRAPLAGAR
jgi:two-component system, NarL family, sensor histidine kinase DesK